MTPSLECYNNSGHFRIFRANFSFFAVIVFGLKRFILSPLKKIYTFVQIEEKERRILEVKKKKIEERGLKIRNT